MGLITVLSKYPTAHVFFFLSLALACLLISIMYHFKPILVAGNK